MTRTLVAALAVTALVGVAGCSNISPYACFDDSQCANGDVDGAARPPARCILQPESNNQAFCVSTDATCPATALRWDNGADHNGGQCVTPQDLVLPDAGPDTTAPIDMTPPIDLTTIPCPDC